MAPGGWSEARAVVHGAKCPDAVIDRADTPMRTSRSASSAICKSSVRRDASEGRPECHRFGTRFALPDFAPHRIMVIGDTGCRIKGWTVQACNDPGEMALSAHRASGREIEARPRHPCRRLSLPRIRLPIGQSCLRGKSVRRQLGKLAGGFLRARCSASRRSALCVRAREPRGMRAFRQGMAAVAWAPFRRSEGALYRPCRAVGNSNGRVDRSRSWTTHMRRIPLHLAISSHFTGPISRQSARWRRRSGLAMHRPIWGVVQLGFRHGGRRQSHHDGGAKRRRHSRIMFLFCSPVTSTRSRRSITRRMHRRRSSLARAATCWIRRRAIFRAAPWAR